MGYMRHSVIVVIGSPDDLPATHAFAVGLGMTVTPIVTSPINHYASFMVAPDGSKEGWQDSAKGDVQREALIERLSDPKADGWFDWAELSFPEDGAARIEQGSGFDE